MKNKLKILLQFLGLAMLFVACTPDNPKMAALLNKSQLQFTVVPDASNPNKIVLTSLTPNVTPYWVTPMGNSTSLVDTIDIPFPGTDTIYYSVEGAGGLVTAEPYVLTITTIDPSYVSDPLWTYLAGGLGYSKTWVLDLDANGVSKYFQGPLYFYGTYDSWETVTAGVTAPSGADSWNWCPSWSGNTWLMPAGNYGTMTFDLKNGVHFTSNNLMIPALGSASGKYMLSPNTHTLTTTGAEILHDLGNDPNVTSWGSIKVMSLTANTMQLGVMRHTCSAGGPCTLVYNFVSQAYYESH
jgi:hypothetical protein